ncbi:hypothetical protein FRACA_520017 [Frankia canadensis]|uniref:Uncharacterized protein n=1 Tax=Frankia canadensis TaxID=1836972 RepID=A0A2I2KYL0_9ACTN|nr:hypothetical protein FRACA_520017 [Frankia canadensis]SOU58041.1 hypothetical protein FRACA_520017 [Frankia canadensis]
MRIPSRVQAELPAETRAERRATCESLPYAPVDRRWFASPLPAAAVLNVPERMSPRVRSEPPAVTRRQVHVGSMFLVRGMAHVHVLAQGRAVGAVRPAGLAGGGLRPGARGLVPAIPLLANPLLVGLVLVGLVLVAVVGGVAVRLAVLVRRADHPSDGTAGEPTDDVGGDLQQDVALLQLHDGGVETGGGDHQGAGSELGHLLLLSLRAATLHREDVDHREDEDQRDKEPTDRSAAVVAGRRRRAYESVHVLSS